MFLVTIMALACGLNQPASAQAVTQCDRLAAHNSDPDKVLPTGVSGKDIGAAAIDACQQAVAADSANLRLRYQLARALAENGRAAEGHADMHLAADGGYRQAQFVLGYLYDEGMQGLSRNPCKAAGLWQRAARAGLFAALISYPHHVVNGHFTNCALDGDTAELRDMLQQAQAMAPDYYQRMIINDLLTSLAPASGTD
jgi:TPR repeat protein